MSSRFRWRRTTASSGSSPRSPRSPGRELPQFLTVGGYLPELTNNFWVNRTVFVENRGSLPARRDDTLSFTPSASMYALAGSSGAIL
ncbi:hypothetical protein F5972_11045 [Microbispora cellulosiformans]|uniref:Uncharacterized protein n=1 Tax=Microbispora cellulosiformans TaxID=2614688 RepID=A0A5J5K699_9ACTN|nr:hypothetical protein [Microbispora cellulosiformans]KAA9380131.1 hypothetical protein F5972_11045 [Microbispora cellulosiformans]